MEKLTLNAVFPNWESFSETLNTYCLDNNYVFVKKFAQSVETANKNIVKNKYPVDWKYKSVQLQCKHYGVKVKGNTTKKRETDSFKTGCTAHIKLHANKQHNGLVITQINLEHTGHLAANDNDLLVYPERRRLDSDQSTQMMALLGMKVQTAEICRYFQETHHIPLTKRDVHNQRQKFFATLSDGLTDAEQTKVELSKLLSDDPGSVVDVTTTDGAATVIFFQTCTMRSDFKRYPHVLFMDGTYKVNNRNMPLYTFMCVDGGNSGRVVAYAVVADETSATLTSLMATFVKHNPIHDDIQTVVIDKDLSEAKAISEVLPNVSFILCKFHVIQAIQRSLKSFSANSRSRIMSCIYKMLSCCSEEDYMANYSFLSEHEPCFFSYFIQHWHSVRGSWAGFCVRNVMTFGNLTNNFVESHNQKIKLAVSRGTSIASLAAELLRLQQSEFVESSLVRSKLKLKKKLVLSYCPFAEDVITLLYEQCAPWSARMMKLELEKSFSMSYVVDVDVSSVMDPNGKSYDVSERGCSCFLFDCRKLVCAHLFAFRKTLDLPLFTVDDVVPQHSKLLYLDNQDSSVPGSLHVSHVSSEKRVLSHSEKFRKAERKLKELSVVLSDRGQDEFDCHFDMLVGILNAIKKGKSVMWMECDSDSTHPVEFSTEVPPAVDSPDAVSSECPDVPSACPSGVRSDCLSGVVPSDAPSIGVPSDCPSDGAPSDSPSSGAPADCPSSGVPADCPSSGAPSDCPSGGAPSDSPSSGAPADCPSSGVPADCPSGGAPSDSPSSGDPSDSLSSGAPSDCPPVFALPCRVRKRGRPKQTKLSLAKKRKVTRDMDQGSKFSADPRKSVVSVPSADSVARP